MSSISRNSFRKLLNWLLYNLYHHLASFYDLISSTVSLGRWREWTFQTIPYITGPVILEVGHGPGHLLRELAERGIPVFGVDESRQMVRIASKNTRYLHVENPESKPVVLTRARAEYLPFSSSVFDSIVATFPTNFILNQDALRNMHRILKYQGRVVILLNARFVRNGLSKWPLEKLDRIIPKSPLDNSEESYRVPFEKAGFQVAFKNETINSASLYFLIAKKLDPT
jgi:ubiquinone/menaquinone biosynthesis C-methylase UbiE